MLYAGTNSVALLTLTGKECQDITKHGGCSKLPFASLILEMQLHQLNELFGWWMLIAITGSNSGNLAVECHGDAKRIELSVFLQQPLCKR